MQIFGHKHTITRIQEIPMNLTTASVKQFDKVVTKNRNPPLPTDARTYTKIQDIASVSLTYPTSYTIRDTSRGSLYWALTIPVRNLVTNEVGLVVMEESSTGISANDLWSKIAASRTSGSTSPQALLTDLLSGVAIGPYQIVWEK